MGIIILLILPLLSSSPVFLPSLFLMDTFRLFYFKGKLFPLSVSTIGFARPRRHFHIGVKYVLERWSLLRIALLGESAWHFGS